MKTSCNQTRPVNECRQQEILSRTGLRQDTVLVKTNSHLRRWKMIKLRLKGRMAKTESHLDTRTMNETGQFEGMAENKFRQNMQQVDNGGLPKQPCKEVYSFKETDRVTLFTKKKYRVAIMFGLIMSRMRSINCVLHTGAGTNLLQEQLSNPIGFCRYAPATAHH